MPIRFVSGDLFENEHDARAFSHGCNCQGSMGAGIAKTFRARYPAMYEAYRNRCKAEPRRFNRRLLALEGRRPTLGVQPGHPGGLLAGSG